MVDQELLLLEALSRGLDTMATVVRQMEDEERAYLSGRFN